jgi:hypothetical protein
MDHGHRLETLLVRLQVGDALRSIGFAENAHGFLERRWGNVTFVAERWTGGWTIAGTCRRPAAIECPEFCVREYVALADLLVMLYSIWLKANPGDDRASWELFSREFHE